MEQIQQLLEILKQTPEMALWGLGLFFLFTLLKMASWIGALSITAKQLIKRYFDYKDKKVLAEDANEILNYFDKNTMNNLPKREIYRLFDAIKSDNLNYIHDSDINEAIKKLKE